MINREEIRLNSLELSRKGLDETVLNESKKAFEKAKIVKVKVTNLNIPNRKY